MKRHLKILLVIICTVVLSTLIMIAASANQTIAEDAQFAAVQVTTSGSVNIKFIYSSLGTAESMVAEIDGAVYKECNVSEIEKDSKGRYVIAIPLSPAQMDDTITVYAKDANGAIGKARSLSVRDYALAILNREDLSSSHNSMRALLNWGAMADIKFYNDDLTEEDEKLTESTINKGFYTRGTNPVNGVRGSFFTEQEGNVSYNSAIYTDVMYNVFLEPNNTRMVFEFTYNGQGSPRVTSIKKGDKDLGAFNMEDLDGDEGNRWRVNLHNLGVTVFTTEYTITVEDGKGNTFTATKTVLEYLNTIAFDQNYSSDAQNLAKSMYQFYTHAMNKTAGCAHTAFHNSLSIDGELEHLTCSTCLKNFRTTSTNAQMFLDVTTADALWGSDTNGTHQIMAEDNVSFIRCAPTGSSGSSYNAINYVDLTSVAKHLVIRYRVSGTSGVNFLIRLNGESSTQYQPTVPYTSGQWQTAVIDISAMGNFQGATNLLVRPQIDGGDSSQTLDIDYIAVVDNAHGMVEDATYTYYTKLASQRYAYTLNKDDCSLSTTVKNDGVDITYEYKCAYCSETLRPSSVISNEAWISDLRNVTSEAEPTSLSWHVENNVEFVRVTPSAQRETCFIYDGGSWTTLPDGKTHGKYIAFKYRVQDANAGTMTFRVSLNNNDTTDNKIDNPYTGDEWKVVVIDVSDYAKAGNYAMIRMMHTNAFDLAFAIMTDDLADIQALLAEDETYWYHGNNLANVGVEYNKHGKLAKSIIWEADLSTIGTVNNEGEFPYATIAPDEAEHHLAGGWGYLPKGTIHGKYIVVKYRVPEGSNFNFRVSFNDNNVCLDSAVENAYTGENWVVAVIDVSGLPEYQNPDLRGLMIRILNQGSQIDIAYAYMTDDIANVKARLADGEVYWDRGTDFGSVGVMYNKDDTHHDLKIDSIAVDGGTKYTYTCSTCGVELAPARTYPDSVSAFTDIGNAGTGMYFTNGSKFTQKLAENNEVFVRCSTTGTGTICDPMTWPSNFGTRVQCPKYIVMKYRATGEVNFQTTAEYSSQRLNITLKETNEWITIVINMEDMANYSDGGDFLVRFYMTNATVDVAYVALASDLAGIIETDTYYYFVGESEQDFTFEANATHLNKDGSCATHTDLTSDGTNWICGRCQNVVAPVRTYPDGYKFIADVSNPGTLTPVFENGEVYLTSSASPTTIRDWQYETYDYIVFKYRVRNEVEGSSFYMQTYCWTVGFANIYLPNATEWTTVVVNVADLTVEGQELTTRFYLTNITLDIAYMVFTDNANALGPIETDTYYYLDATAGDVYLDDAQQYNQDGSCVAHTTCTSDGANWICDRCKHIVAPVRTYPNTYLYLSDYSNPGTLTPAVENGEVYLTSSASPTTIRDWAVETYDYIVFKYRVRNAVEGSSFYMQTYCWGADLANIYLPNATEWTTVVVNVADLMVEGGELITRFYLTNITLDIAYMVFTDDANALAPIETETYYYFDATGGELHHEDAKQYYNDGTPYIDIGYKPRPEQTQSETISKIDGFVSQIITVEGEAADSHNLPTTPVWMDRTKEVDGVTGSPDDHDGGIFFANFSPVWDLSKAYTIKYSVTIEYDGWYNIEADIGDIDASYTSNYSLVIDKKTRLTPSAANVKDEPTDIYDPCGSELFQTIDLGTVYLTAGTHEFMFVVDQEDAMNDRPEFDRIVFALDYFTLTRTVTENSDAPVINYNADISGDSNATILKNAANLNVFDSRYPVRINFTHIFNESVDQGQYRIVDFYGNDIYRYIYSGDKDNVNQVEIVLNNHPTGYFILKVGEKTVMSYVVTSSLEERSLTDSPFAMDFASTNLIGDDLDKVADYASALRMLGVTWVRDRFSWGSYQINFVDGVSTFDDEYMASFKEHMGVIKDAGLNIIALMHGAPGWANEYASNFGGTWENQYGYLGTQLGIYDGAKNAAIALDGLVDILEISNEPDLKGGDLAEVYASWFKSAALGIIDSGADVKISIAGLCKTSNDMDFLSLLMSSDVMKYSSIFNYHAHHMDVEGIKFPEEGTVPDFGSIISPTVFSSALDLYGVEKPIWITEAGMKIQETVAPSDSEKKTQAPYVVTSAIQSLSYGTDKHFWFVGVPYIEGGGDFGSFSANGQPYPTMAAYATMTRVLGEGQYYGELKGMPENARGYLFYTGESTDKYVFVLWATEGTVEYAFNSTLPVIVTDMMGNESLVSPQSGKVTLTLSANPVYVTCIEPPVDDIYMEDIDAIPELEMPTVEAGDYVVITPEFQDFSFNSSEKVYGHKIKNGTVINVRVVNHSKETVSGNIAVSIPNQYITANYSGAGVTVAPHSEAIIKVTIKVKSAISLRLNPIDSHITFTGTFNGKACSPATAHVYSSSSSRTVLSATFASNMNVNNGTTTKDVLSSAKVTLNSNVDNVVININGEEFTEFTRNGKNITLDLSTLEDGKYTISIGCISKGADQQIVHLTLRIDGDTVRFGTQW